jgi:hypothetical protein
MTSFDCRLPLLYQVYSQNDATIGVACRAPVRCFLSIGAKFSVCVASNSRVAGMGCAACSNPNEASIPLLAACSLGLLHPSPVPSPLDSDPLLLWKWCTQIDRFSHHLLSYLQIMGHSLDEISSPLIEQVSQAEYGDSTAHRGRQRLAWKIYGLHVEFWIVILVLFNLVALSVIYHLVLKTDIEVCGGLKTDALFGTSTFRIHNLNSISSSNLSPTKKCRFSPKQNVYGRGALLSTWDTPAKYHLGRFNAKY